ncbi:hypothetical protein EDC04DRAFT_2691204, partial [Pisolithus marmoratus]
MDQQNRAAYDDSAKLRGAAGAIRTIASLTREDDCLKLYSSSQDVLSEIQTGMLSGVTSFMRFLKLARSSSLLP